MCVIFISFQLYLCKAPFNMASIYLPIYLSTYLSVPPSIYLIFIKKPRINSWGGWNATSTNARNMSYLSVYLISLWTTNIMQTCSAQRHSVGPLLFWGFPAHVEGFVEVNVLRRLKVPGTSDLRVLSILYIVFYLQSPIRLHHHDHHYSECKIHLLLLGATKLLPICCWQGIN